MSGRSLAFLSYVAAELPPNKYRDGRPPTPPVPIRPPFGSWILEWHVVEPHALSPLDSHPDFATTGLRKPALFRWPDKMGNPDRLAVRGDVLEAAEFEKGLTGGIMMPGMPNC